MIIKRWEYHYVVFHEGKCVMCIAAWRTNMSEVLKFAFNYAQSVR